MAIPPITALPTPPSRGSAPDTFVANADLFLDALPTFGTELNTAAAAIDAAVMDAEQAVIDATAAATGTFSGTSTTSLAVGTGSKVFTTQADKNWVVGTWLLAASAANPANYMLGQVTAYSGTSLTVNVTATGGSGTLADWNIAISGPRGAAGSGSGDMLAANNLSDLVSASTARTNLGLGSLATASTINNSNWSGTDLAIANGGTGASTAADARTALGAAASGAATASGLTIATDKLLGRDTAGTGALEEIGIGAGLTLSGGQLSVTAGGGTVTSVDISGGTTGLTATGGPITGSGTITLAGTLAVANGGTGTTASTGSGNVVLSASPTLTGTAAMASATISGTLGMADGTAAAPSIRFSGDTDTGLFRSAANTIGIAAGGTQVARFSTTAIYLDVATAAPSLTVDAGSATAPSFGFTSDTNTGFYSVGADQLGVSTAGTLRVTVSTTALTSTLPVRVNDGSAATPSFSFANYTDSGLYTSAGGVHIATGGSSRFNVSASGVVASVALIANAGGVNAFQIASSATPASASASGTAGSICWDSSYIYVCVATNTWKRVAIATW